MSAEDKTLFIKSNTRQTNEISPSCTGTQCPDGDDDGESEVSSIRFKVQAKSFRELSCFHPLRNISKGHIGVIFLTWRDDGNIPGLNLFTDIQI